MRAESTFAADFGVNAGTPALDSNAVLKSQPDPVGVAGGRRIRALAVATLIWTAGVFGAYLYTAVSRPNNFTGVYNASAYWVTYEDGFVRRGLIGSVAAAVLGHPLDHPGATTLGVLIFVAGLLAFGWLAKIVVSAVERPVRLFAGTVVLASPFTFSLLVQTRGRYDSVVVAGMVLVAISFLVAPQSGHHWYRIVAVALTNVVAVGAEEFAFGFLAPLTVVGVLRMGGTRLRPVAHGVVALVPALLVVVASSVSHPRIGYLVELTDRVRRAGFPLDSSQESSISALGQTTRNALAFTAGISPLSVAACAVVLGGCYALSSTVLWVCCGRRHPRAVFTLMASYALVALFISAFADDYRRWWGLAFVAMTASTLLLVAGERSRARHARTPRVPTRRTVGVLAVALLIASAAAQLFPLWPTWDEGADTDISIDYVLSHR
jgi:hypothetical protein